MSGYTVELINNWKKLNNLIDRLTAVPVIALDIETVDWWNHRQERVALVQIAFRTGSRIKVAVTDTLGEFDLEPLRSVLESEATTKIIHNAVFDARRLTAHYQFKVAPIFDTMVAARRNREPKYSLPAQARDHLNLRLDKSAQKSDWSRRPLDAKQIYYAASDAFAALLLYENQTERRLNGDFQLKQMLPPVESQQAILPLTDTLDAPIVPQNTNRRIGFEESVSKTSRSESESDESDLNQPVIALLGIITELAGRYHPDGLAVSVGAERIGIAGWIADRILGKDADLDEETAKLGIVELVERKLVVISEARRLAATAEGARIWEQMKSKRF